MKIQIATYLLDDDYSPPDAPKKYVAQCKPVPWARGDLLLWRIGKTPEEAEKLLLESLPEALAVYKELQVKEVEIPGY